MLHSALLLLCFFFFFSCNRDVVCCLLILTEFEKWASKQFVVWKGRKILDWGFRVKQFWWKVDVFPDLSIECSPALYVWKLMKREIIFLLYIVFAVWFPRICCFCGGERVAGNGKGVAGYSRVRLQFKLVKFFILCLSKRIFQPFLVSYFSDAENCVV